jgi:hypothetical protein
VEGRWFKNEYGHWWNDNGKEKLKYAGKPVMTLHPRKILHGLAWN